jgi:hypothetical protein
MRIFKYVLPHSDGFGNFSLNLPIGARILSIQEQSLVYVLWALVDENADASARTISMIGTGWEIRGPDTLVYINTIQQGSFVWHFFERVPVQAIEDGSGPR